MRVKIYLNYFFLCKIQIDNSAFLIGSLKYVHSFVNIANYSNHFGQSQSSFGALLAMHSFPGHVPHLPTSQHRFHGSSIKL